jgi:MFS family permease
MKPNLRILLLSSFFLSLATGFFGPIYAVFVEEIGGDLLTAGSAYAAFSIASGVLIFFLSRWEDHVKHQERLLIGSRVLSVIGFAGYLLIGNPLDLFIVQLILGISAAIGYPAFDSMYSKNLDRGKFASEWGMWESMYCITLGIAAITGGYIAQIYGFRLLFIVMIIISILSLIVSLFLVKRR